MELAYTGTQHGMNAAQRHRVFLLTIGLDPEKVHHGDCIGGDAEFHRIARQANLYVVRHPPIALGKRAFCDYDEDRDPEEFLDRNHTMIDESDALIAAPRTSTEVVRSGTWATIRYARTQGKPVYIVQPSGKYETIGVLET
jgi:hypothetical protein